MSVVEIRQSCVLLSLGSNVAIQFGLPLGNDYSTCLFWQALAKFYTDLHKITLWEDRYYIGHHLACQPGTHALSKNANYSSLMTAQECNPTPGGEVTVSA